MNRPRMPKNAPLDTVMLVPVRGPMMAVGITASVPMAVPTTIDVTVCQNDSPNRIANAPNTTFVQVRLAPRKTAPRLRGRESRALLGQVLDARGSRWRRSGRRSACERGRFCEGGHGCSIRLVDGLINSVDVVFNKNRDPSRGRSGN